MILTISYSVERGRNKPQCDDTALAGTNVLNEAGGTVTIPAPAWVCLCDGVGGNAGGAEASAFVCCALAGTEPSGSADTVADIFRKINSGLLERAAETPDRKNMATTATALSFAGDGTALAHIGNTRLYSIRGGFMKQITKDQTTYQWLLDRGDEESARCCNRNEIRGAMGGGRPEFMNLLETSNPFERKTPSGLLLTSDGVHEYLTEDELEAIVGEEGIPDEEKAEKLCRAALEKGSDDDRSAILIRITD